MLPRVRVPLDASTPLRPLELFTPPVREVWLEIGFGGGEHLIHRALEAPSTGFIGVEPFINSMQKLLARVDETGARNVRVYNDDATQLLDWLPDHCLDQIDLLITDLAVFSVKRGEGLTLVERAPDVTVAEIQQMTGCAFATANDVKTIAVAAVKE